MHNLLNDTPDSVLHGRLRYSIKLVSSISLRNKVVLDIGCGYGWFEKYALSQNVKKIVGTEISSADLNTIRSNITNPKLVTKVASATKLPFPDKTFDLVTLWEVLEHVPKLTEQKVFNEISRVLKPGGYFLLSTPHSSFISKIFDPAWWLIGHRHYSTSQVQDYAKSAQLSTSNIKVMGRWWEIIGNLNMYACKWLFHRKPIFDNKIQSQLDKEYKNKSGFMTLFAVFQKIK